MAVLFTDSFDHYNSTAIAADKWTSFGATGPHTIVPAVGRCGSQAALFGGGLQISNKGLTLLGSTDRGYCGFALYPILIGGGDNFVGVYLNGNSGIFHWMAAADPSGAINITNGFTGSTIASTPAGILHTGNYQFVEIFWIIHSSAGQITIRVNGVQVLNATGINTKVGSTSAWDTFSLLGNANASHYIDDLYVLDDYDDGKTPATNTFLGDCRVEYLRPTADGNYVGQWTVVGGGSQYQAVDKNNDPSGTSVYIKSATPGQLATDVYADTSVGTGTVFNVGVNTLVSKDNSGPRTVKNVVRNAGSDGLGASYSPNQTSPVFNRDSFDRDPSSGNGWTISTVNSAEFGVKLVT